MVNWRHFETILLDMDGTILDLAYDNYFWRELVPRCLARERNVHPDEVTPELYAHFERLQGSIEWYCLDYWTSALSLDLRALKAASSHRVRYLPGAAGFLEVLRASGKRVILVTNAHEETLRIKKGVAGLGRYIDHFVTSHEFGAPKESPAFWSGAQARLAFDPATTLFIDDSVPVLDAACAHGLAGVLAVRRPDTRQPSREIERHTAVEGLGQLI
ncbi:MAG: GMP/IMP nucleotidase [Gammaproteobacteria bacterium]|nr:GMP/IMP nucleotidase [Gammaproteobacteria bacterium]